MPPETITDDADRAEQDDHLDGTDQSDQHDHLEDIDDGCGCAEVWEHLSEGRADD